jgi:hypothetical protein
LVFVFFATFVFFVVLTSTVHAQMLSVMEAAPMDAKSGWD